MPNQNNEFDKKATFIQHLLPGLEVGEYVLEVEQEIWEKGKKKKLDSTKLSRLIAVQGPRLSLDASTIESIYPPDISNTNGLGPYDNCLPHIILKGNPALPWLREPTIENQSKEPMVRNGVKHDPEVAPWMAVLVIHEDEISSGNGFLFDDFDNTITRGLAYQMVPEGASIFDYNLKGVYDISKLKEDERKGKLPIDHYSIFSHQLYENGSRKNVPEDVIVSLGLGDKPLDSCRYISLKKEYFQTIAPTLEDLKLMAHVRQVDTTNQPRNTPAPPMQRYSVVLANRIPKKGKSMAILVSLEHLEHILPESAIEVEEKYVRIPVLYNWQFDTGEDASNDFEFALKTLNSTPYQEDKEGVSNVQLHKPHFQLIDTSPEEYDSNTKEGRIKEALKKGFVPFNHITRGEEGKNDPVQTVSWYRGPLVPYRVPEGKVIFKETLEDGSSMVHSANSSDELLRYDTDLHMLDTSYAAAWQLGRLLCLEDKLVAGEMYEWKRHNELNIIAQKESEVLVNQVSYTQNDDLSIDNDNVSKQPSFQQVNHLTMNKIADFFNEE